MKVSLEERGHQIFVERTLTQAKLTVDGKEFDAPGGIITNSIEIVGKAVNSDGSEDKVKAVIGVNPLTGKIDIFYNGKKIYTGKSILFANHL